MPIVENDRRTHVESVEYAFYGKYSVFTEGPLGGPLEKLHGPPVENHCFTLFGPRDLRGAKSNVG